jgi:hypothetical protein
MEELKKVPGALAASLLRNSSKIKEDRALAIVRTAEKYFRRKVEDIQDRITNSITERDNLLDLSPTDINSLVLATDFKADQFYDSVRRITLAIREAKVELEEMQAQYENLFGAKQTPQATA